jgi:hypothetical protein
LPTKATATTKVAATKTNLFFIILSPFLLKDFHFSVWIFKYDPHLLSFGLASWSLCSKPIFLLFNSLGPIKFS